MLAQQICVLCLVAEKALLARALRNTTNFTTKVREFLAVLLPSMGFNIPGEATIDLVLRALQIGGAEYMR